MINTYNESDLHRELKQIFCPPQASMEVPLMGSVCDILYDKSKKIIEIQTSNISALRLKLEKFLPKYKVKIVYPIILTSYIVALNKDGSKRYRRKSPKHGTFFQIFRELSGLYHLINSKNLSLTIVYIECEVIKQYGIGLHKKNKNRPSVVNKKLLKIVKTENYKNLMAVCLKILELLPREFTNKELQKIGAGKYSSYTSWFFKKAELIFTKGRDGRYIKYCKSK